MTAVLPAATRFKVCGMYARGYCPLGAACDFSHELGSEVTTRNTDTEVSSVVAGAELLRIVDDEDRRFSSITCSSPLVQECSRGPHTDSPDLAYCDLECGGSCRPEENVHPLARKQAEAPKRRAWRPHSKRAGILPGAQAGEVRECSREFDLPSSHSAKEHRALTKAGPLVREQAVLVLERARLSRLAEQDRERQERAAEIAKEEAAKTIQHVVLGSIVTFGAGLNVNHIITGFECCFLRIKNLPIHANEDAVRTLLTQQGVDIGHFQLVSLERHSDTTQEAVVAIDVVIGGLLQVGLDGLKFGEVTLVFEVDMYHIPGSMKSIAAQDTDTPMHYLVTIPAKQYVAQKAQWVSLHESIKNKKACNLIVFDQEDVTYICVQGTVKQAIGALKVRVESLLVGEQVEGWHSAFGYPDSIFVRVVFYSTGAYLQADRRHQVLSFYGAPTAVEHARQRVKAELERLSCIQRTFILARESIRYFVHHGIPALKETFGENSVRFVASTGTITISGGEKAQHELVRLITESLSEIHDLRVRSPVQQTCPICYDAVSAPFQLGCGHVYCTACLRHFLTSAAESDHFPLVCMGDEDRCGTPIPVPTLQRFLLPGQFNRLLEVAFDKYVAQHVQEFRFCKTPGCTQLYRAAARATAVQCPSCFATICTACHEDAHNNLTCLENRIRMDRAEQERLNDEWIAQQAGRVKKCPSCSVPIEKLEGCNHITCR